MKNEIVEWYKEMSFRFWKIENQNGKLIASVPVEKDGKGDPEAEKLERELARLERLNNIGTYSVGGSERNGKEYSYQTFVVGNQNNQSEGFKPSQTNTTLAGLELAAGYGRLQSELAIQPLKLALEQKEKEISELKKKKPESEGFGLGLLIQEAIRQTAPELMKQVLPIGVKWLMEVAPKAPAIYDLINNVCASPTIQEGIKQAGEAYFKNTLNDGNSE